MACKGQGAVHELSVCEKDIQELRLQFTDIYTGL
jgi:hypothetical protein